MVKEIGILEFHCHVKYLYTMAKIVKTKETNVTIFTTEELFSKVKTYLKNLKDYNIILKKQDESLSSFFKRVEQICTEKIDLLFINTIQKTMLDFPLFFGFKPKCKMIITIHTANAWFYKKPIIDFKKIFRTVDTNLSTITGRKMILSKFNGINVIYAPIKEFIKEKTPYEKPVFTIPFGFYEGTDKQQITKEEKILFIVPGQIEEHRRDYDTLLDSFETLFEKHHKEITLHLLGYPVGNYGKRIVNRCIQLKQKDYDIIFHHSFVPEHDYNKNMKKADFFILPIKILSHGVGVIPEYYGKTKGSAAVFEGIQYAKPMVVPNEFNMLQELKSSTLSYDNTDHLTKLLSEIIDNREKLKKLTLNAKENSNKYSLDKLQDYFKKEIFEKIDSL